jgi:TPR repeat protein
LVALADIEHYQPAAQYLAKYYNLKGDAKATMVYLDMDMRQKSFLARMLGILRGFSDGSEMRSLKEGARRNYATAFRELGIAYDKGKYGVEPDIDLALKNLEKAVSMGDSQAQIELARILMQEYRRWTDKDRAVELLKYAAKTNPKATFILTGYFNKLVEQGKISPRSLDYLEWNAKAGDKHAFEQLKKMNTGHANAILGQMYAEGKGVEQGINAAHIYYVKAIDKGYEPAKALLADLKKKAGLD